MAITSEFIVCTFSVVFPAHSFNGKYIQIQDKDMPDLLQLVVCEYTILIYNNQVSVD